MSTNLSEIARKYDIKYRNSEFFHYRKWLFRPFVKAIVAKARLQSGYRVLDAGCGQGFFSGLFAELGMRTLGVDISSEAIRMATGKYGSSGATFEVGDVEHLHFENSFDCVFVRGCSLYNSEDFAANQRVTDGFLRYAKPGGVLIFDYYTNLCTRKKSKSWQYHSVAAAKRHFSGYTGAEVYFSLRLDTLLFGRFAFSRIMSQFGKLFSSTTGFGGDLVVFVPRI